MMANNNNIDIFQWNSKSMLCCLSIYSIQFINIERFFAPPPLLSLSLSLSFVFFINPFHHTSICFSYHPWHLCIVLAHVSLACHGNLLNDQHNNLSNQLSLKEEIELEGEGEEKQNGMRVVVAFFFRRILNKLYMNEYYYTTKGAANCHNHKLNYISTARYTSCDTFGY